MKKAGYAVILFTLVLFITLCGLADETLTFVRGERLDLFNKDGVIAYLTGKVEDSGMTFIQLDAVIENQSDHPIGVKYEGTGNGWMLGTCWFGNGGENILPHAKVRTYLWVKYDALDIKRFSQLESLCVSFSVNAPGDGSLNQPEEIYFTVDNVTILFGKEAETVREKIYYDDQPALPKPESYLDVKQTSNGSTSTNGKLTSLYYTYQPANQNDTIDSLVSSYTSALASDGCTIHESDTAWEVWNDSEKLCTISIKNNAMRVDIETGNSEQSNSTVGFATDGIYVGREKSPDQQPSQSIPIFHYSVDESAVPFHQLDWGMSIKDVEEITGGIQNDSGTLVNEEITIPELGGSYTATYQFSNGKLSSVLMFIQTGLTEKKDCLATAEGMTLYRIMESFFKLKEKDSPHAFHAASGSVSSYLSETTNASSGYLWNGKGYDLGLMFCKAESFKDQLFRKSNSYETQANKNDTYFITEQSKGIYWFEHKYTSPRKNYYCSGFYNSIRLTHSSDGEAFIPMYVIRFAYRGTKNPAKVSTFSFSIDNYAYVFNISVNPAINDLNEYDADCILYFSAQNESFLDALAATKKNR